MGEQALRAGAGCSLLPAPPLHGLQLPQLPHLTMPWLSTCRNTEAKQNIYFLLTNSKSRMKHNCLCFSEWSRNYTCGCVISKNHSRITFLRVQSFSLHTIALHWKEAVLLKRSACLPEVTECDLCLIPFRIPVQLSWSIHYSQPLEIWGKKRKRIIIKSHMRGVSTSMLLMFRSVVFVRGSCLVPYRMFNGNPELYPQDARSSLPVVTTKNISQNCQMSLRGAELPCLKTTTLYIIHTNIWKTSPKRKTLDWKERTKRRHNSL